VNGILYDADGGQQILASPVKVTLQRSVSAPADVLEAVFPLTGPVRPAAFFRMAAAGKVLFDGPVDTMRETDGRLLHLSVRSRAALLLDSQALPGTWLHPGLRNLFQTCAVPYGFTQIVGDMRVFDTPYTIDSNKSEWQALDTFCQSFLGTALWEENGVLRAEQPTFSEPAVLGKSGIPYLKVCRTWQMYRQLSEVWGIRSGELENCIQDSAVRQTGILRRRISAAPEAALQEACGQVQTTSVLCVGWQPVKLWQPAVLWLPQETLQLQVKQILYQLSTEGKTTRLLLQNG
jgi:hypothetical protein